MPPSHANTSRTGGPDLVLEPEPIREWLNQFREILENLGRRRDALEGLAFAAGTIHLGDLTFATPLRSKLVDRLGQEEGGAAWVVNEIVLELTSIHEAMRQSLAAQLHADFEAERVMGRLHTGSHAGAAG